MGARRVVWEIVVALAALVLVVMPGCGDGTTSPTGPDITGIVWQVTGAGDVGSLLVVGVDGIPSSYDRASVSATPETVWQASDGSALDEPAARDLAGRRVSVWFTGPVRESYPVQATAATIRLLEPTDVSVHVSPAGTPQVSGTAESLVRDAAGRVTAIVVRPETGAATVRRIPVVGRTTWLLETPTELKGVAGAPLIGNGLEAPARVRLERGAAVWVAVRLPQ